MTENRQRRVECPQCGQPSLYDSSNRHRPFCSERCKQIDLGAWASESHRMPDENPPDDIEGLDRPS
jgi:endogenous inhibitor of DNA gyrase (YacG/DUF329 family)